jgi:drug/metabolite transporter (DMT)-like permease
MKLQHSNAATPAGLLTAFASIYLIWGTTYLAIAIVIQTMPPFVAGGFRFVAASLLMYVWLRSHGESAFAGVNVPMAVLCGVLLSGIGNGFVFWAQQGIPSGIAALIVTSVPVMVLVLDWMFFTRRAPSPKALLGVAIALTGVVTIVMHTHELTGAARPLYLLAVLAANVGWSFGTLLQKRSAQKDTVLGFTCVQMLAGGVFQLVMATVDGEWASFELSRIASGSWLALLYLIVFGSIVALNSYLWLLTRVPAQKVTTYALVNPVVALLLGALVLNERITSLAATAAVLVLLGVALVLFQDFHPLRLLRERRARAALRDI